MAKSTGKRHQKTLEKIAAILGKSLDEVKQMHGAMPTEEKIYEASSLYHYFEWRKAELKRGLKESEPDFDLRNKKWKYKICKECGLEFAYSYLYDSVSFCSLLCVENNLKRQGLEVDWNRPIESRWGYVGRPAVVPNSALVSVESALSASSSHSEPL